MCDHTRKRFIVFKEDISKFPMADTVLKALETNKAEERINDGDNLYFVIKKDGKKRCEFRYKKPATGKWTFIGLGSYPQVSGKLARQKAMEARNQLSDGIDPKDAKDQQKQDQIQQSSGEFLFQKLAEEYYASKTWTNDTRVRNEGALRNHVYPLMGSRDYRTIKKVEWLDLFKTVQKKLHPKTKKPIVEMGQRVCALCRDIYDLAEVTGRVDQNPVANIHKHLEKHVSVNMPHVAEKELPDLLVKVVNYPTRQTAIGLQLALMLGTRPNEIRRAEWSEFDFEEKLWVIPAHKMKKRVEHTIPLSSQVIELLKELKVYSGSSPYLFRGRNSGKEPISNATLGNALKKLGYNGKQTPHGFRHIMSTALRERGFRREWVESALAHKLGGVEGVYNKALYLEQRRKMMQIWSDYLDALANGKSFEFDNFEMDKMTEYSWNDIGLEKNKFNAKQLRVLQSFIEAMVQDDDMSEEEAA